MQEIWMVCIQKMHQLEIFKQVGKISLQNLDFSYSVVENHFNEASFDF